MDLIRNTTKDGRCKYALVERLKDDRLEYGLPGTEDEFFVLKLKDKHAKAALEAYVASVKDEDPEYARQIQELADRAGADSPWCKAPDN
ncbi:hypothetical protein [Neptuniibacter sp. QD37_11]|uniref:hypothetical protein n=1 Tax=Neptuniibacter sp. QD37_11 TaxID=3398209 RepID=UPI0039F5345E